MNNLRISLAKISDKEFIQKIHKQSKKEIGGFNLFYSWDKYLKKESKYLFYIFKNELNEKIGFVRFGYSKKEGFNVIKEIGIDIEQRKKGYGKKIIELLPKPIYLTCNCDNIIGNKFYNNVGFLFYGNKKLKNGSLSNIWILK